MKTLLKMAGLTALLISAAAAAETVHPAKVSKADAAGAIFKRPDMVATTHEDGHKTEDVTSLLSSDGRFASGMYKSGKTRAEITEPYGVDEFMYFLEGSVTLVSSDGTVTEVLAGEAVTVPKEWTGTWITEGYTKFWVIYSEDPDYFE
ncbi:MAG: cupin domain-containing protein [Halieaceae bacterium]|nr:cupin domain-containing protein [Halieaceae bacterium]